MYNNPMNIGESNSCSGVGINIHSCTMIRFQGILKQ
jgi:hypothetical protein